MLKVGVLEVFPLAIAHTHDLCLLDWCGSGAAGLLAKAA